MDIQPIFNAMMRNKVGAVLIGLQIAITLAIVTNAMFIIEERSTLMERPSGVDEANTFYMNISGVSEDYNAEDELLADLELMRNLPGIVDVSTVNSVPLSNSGSSNSFTLTPDDDHGRSIRTSIYRFDNHFINSFGLNLIEGENFTDEDINFITSEEDPSFTKIIVTKDFAVDAFGEEGAPYVGKVVYDGRGEGKTITGVIETLQVPWAGGEWTRGWDGNSVVLPIRRNSNYQRFFVRTEPGRLDQMIPLVVEKLRERNPERIIREPQSFSDIRYERYRGDIAMKSILTTTVLILFVITSLGVVGLASFTVNRRKKQIGTRRALGARKIDIIRYFLTENWLITTMGLTLGAVLTYLLNFWLVETYSMTRISWYYVPGGMVVLWLLGLIAVYMPARKAASISPAMATRSV